MKFVTDKVYLIITILNLMFSKIRNLCMFIINFLYFICTKLLWVVSYLLSIIFYYIFHLIFIFFVKLLFLLLTVSKTVTWFIRLLCVFIIKTIYIIGILFVQSFYTVRSFILFSFKFIYEGGLIFVETIYNTVTTFYSNFNRTISLYHALRILFGQSFIFFNYIISLFLKIINRLIYNLVYTIFIRIGLLRVIHFIEKLVRLLFNNIGLLGLNLINNSIALFKVILGFLNSIFVLINVSVKTLITLFFNIFKITFWKNIFYNIYYFITIVTSILYTLIKFFIIESLVFAKFSPSFLKNLIIFIGEDLLKLKKVFTWSLTHIIRFLSIIGAILIILMSLVTFYKDKEILNNNVIPKWQNIRGFVDINNLLQKILNSDVFKPVVFYNVSLILPEGANIFSLLIKEGVSLDDANNVTDSINQFYNIKNIKPGWRINITIAKSRDWLHSKVQKLSIPVNNTYDLITEADNNYNYTTYKKIKKLTRYLIRRRIVVQDSIYKSTIAAGVPDAITTEILKVLSWDVDFQREIRSNDKLDIVFECLYNQNNELVTCDNILYVALKGSVKTTNFYKYNGVYYHDDGRTVAKTLVKTPINNARLSSNFGVRNHPVLGYTLLHKGVDFAAPIGTPIYASGDGVIQIRQLSTTYGNFIRIKHNEHLSSLYAHMVAFAPGLKVGSRVKQWQIIGYVGRTGRVTGPHLHYEVIINGRQVNPLTIQMPSEKRLSQEELKNFELQRIDFDNLIIKIPLRGKIVSPIDEVNREGGITNMAFNGKIIDKK